MNWRRGLVLAAINVVISVPGVIWEAIQYWPNTGADIAMHGTGRLKNVLFQEEMTVSLDPCNWFDIGHSRLVEVGAFANLPTALLTGWHDPCLTRTYLGRAVRRTVGARNHMAEIIDCISLVMLILIQWLLVGAYPLYYGKSWYLEPGAFITVAAGVGMAIALVPVINSLARVLALLAGTVWLWYFALLLWIPIRHTWQSTLHGLRRLS